MPKKSNFSSTASQRSPSRSEAHHFLPPSPSNHKSNNNNNSHSSNANNTYSATGGGLSPNRTRVITNGLYPATPIISPARGEGRGAAADHDNNTNNNNNNSSTSGIVGSNAPSIFRSVSQLAYVDYGYAKAEMTRTTHPKPFTLSFSGVGGGGEGGQGSLSLLSGGPSPARSHSSLATYGNNNNISGEGDEGSHLSPGRNVNGSFGRLDRPPVVFAGRSNAEASYTNTSTPAVRPTMLYDKRTTPHLPFTENSEQRTNYQNFSASSCRRSPCKQQLPKRDPIPLRGEPEAKKAFVDHKITSVPPLYHCKEHTLPKTSFTATSTMRASYAGLSK